MGQQDNCYFEAWLCTNLVLIVDRNLHFELLCLDFSLELVSLIKRMGCDVMLHHCFSSGGDFRRQNTNKIQRQKKFR